jgi:hypothetical protein
MTSVNPITSADQMIADPPVQPTLSFTEFVVSLASTAAIHLGDLADPESGERFEPNLTAARQMIDVLGLLEVKTRGNLTAQERQVLDQLLHELRMRFVEVERGGPRLVMP